MDGPMGCSAASCALHVYTLLCVLEFELSWVAIGLYVTTHTIESSEGSILDCWESPMQFARMRVVNHCDSGTTLLDSAVWAGP